MTFRMTIADRGGNKWELDMTLGATSVQECDRVIRVLETIRRAIAREQAIELRRIAARDHARQNILALVKYRADCFERLRKP